MTRRALIALASGALALSLLSVPAFGAQTTSGFDTPAGSGLPLVFANGGQQVGEWDTMALNVTGGFNATGNAVLTGSVTALYYAHTSDARLKTHIHPVTNALDKLLLLHGVEFKWRNSGHRDMGVVAQDVAKVFPSVVSTNSAGIKSVEYDSLIAPMIEAIRELKAENDSLCAEMKEMKARLDFLKGE